MIDMHEGRVSRHAAFGVFTHTAIRAWGRMELLLPRSAIPRDIPHRRLQPDARRWAGDERHARCAVRARPHATARLARRRSEGSRGIACGVRRAERTESVARNAPPRGARAV